MNSHNINYIKKKHSNFDNIVNREGTFSVKWAEVTEKNLLPMHLADMDFLTDTGIINALNKRAKHGIYGYTFYPETFFNSINFWFNKRHNWDIKKRWVSVCHGVISSLNISIRAFSDIGDKVIIQPPVYYPFYSIIDSNRRVVLENKLIYKNKRYEINFDEFDKLTKDAKLFILCNPHNPVGRVWEKEELTLLGDICLKNNVTIISDDIHCDFTYGAKYTPVASLNSACENICVTCLSPSKTFNLAGLNTSITAIPNKSLYDRFDAERIKSGFGRVNIFGITALETAYRRGGSWLNKVLNYLNGNLKLVVEMLSRSKNIDLIIPEGTYLVWLDFRKTGLSEEKIGRILRDQVNIISEPGSKFGPSGRGFQRLNISCSRLLLKKHIKRLINKFDRI